MPTMPQQVAEQAVASWQQFLGFSKAIERLGNILASVPAVAHRMKLPAPTGKAGS